MKLAERFRCILNFTDETLESGEFPSVTDLAAALTVERRLVEQHLDGFADLGALYAFAVPDNREDHALALITRIAGELGRAIFLGKVEPDVLVRFRAGALPGSAGLGLLLGHCRVEPGAIHLQPARTQRILGQIVGEAEGVVELERGLAGKRPTLAQSHSGVVEELEAVHQ